MDIADILTWVAEQRAAAEIQRQRWQGVDPSRLLEALDLIEQLMGRPGEAEVALSDIRLGVMRCNGSLRWGWPGPQEVHFDAMPLATSIHEEMVIVRQFMDLPGREVRIVPGKRLFP